MGEVLDNVIPAVSVAAIRDDKVLLVKRGRSPSRGYYAFPGGRVEAGETDEEAARRELLEETGVSVGELRLLRIVHIPPSTAEGAPGYTLKVFAATMTEGEPVAGDDADEAAFYDREEIAQLPTTDSTLEIVLELMGGAGR